VLVLLILGGLALMEQGAGGERALAQQPGPQTVVPCAPPSVTVSATPRFAVAGQAVRISYAAVAGVGCVNPPLPTMLITFGDGTAPLPLSGPNGTVTHTYPNPGTYTVLVTATSAGLTGQGTTTVAVTSRGQPPVVSLAASPQTAQAGQAVNFTGQVLWATPGAITTRVRIDFGDGFVVTPQTTGAGFIAQHVYAAPGSYIATLSVTDTTGLTGRATTTVTVTPSGQQPIVTLTAAPQTALVGQSVSFTGQVISDTPGAVTTSATINFGDGQVTTPLTTGTGFIAQHTYSRPGVYGASLTVTDSTGATGQATVTIIVSAPAVRWP
jgi:PKD repeat protein